MLRDRLAVTVLLLPVVLWGIGVGGWVYSLAIALVLALAAAEFALFFRAAGQRPSMLLLVGGAAALAVTRALSDFALAPGVLTALCLLGMTWHLDDYERGAPVRTELAATFGIPMHRIRVRVPYLGGGYGAKLYAKLEPLVTALALITKKPVRYALTREEEFLTITKHKVVTKIKTAIKNGAITARKCEVYWDTGAYAEIGPRIGHKSGYTSAGPYKIPNVWIDSYCVYTNKVPAGAFRGFGVPQVIWAYDSQTDMIARALGVDPVEFRLQPALDDGAQGQPAPRTLRA